MPIVHVELLRGRSSEQKRLLVSELTRVVVEVAGASPDAVHVVIDEIDAENWGRAGSTMAERQAVGAMASPDAGL